DCRTTLKGHTAPIRAVAFHPDGKLLASAEGEGKPLSTNARSELKVWDTDDGRVRATLPVGILVHRLRFSPGGARLAACGTGRMREEGNLTLAQPGEVRVLDVPSGKVRLSLSGHPLPVVDASFSPDGRQLATASVDGTVRLRNMQTGDARHVLKGHSGTVW